MSHSQRRPHAVVKARVRKRPNRVPDFALFLTVAAMVWFAWWAFWSAR